MIKYTLTFVLLSLLISCNSGVKPTKEITPAGTHKMEEAAWLLGHWKISIPDGEAAEIWVRQNDSLFLGKSFFIVGKDTVSSESIRLELKGGDMYYVPTVKNQNAGLPVRFKLANTNAQQLSFENPEHDFPKKIIYSKISPDSIVAEVSGGDHREQFPMKRVK